MAGQTGSVALVRTHLLSPATEENTHVKTMHINFTGAGIAWGMSEKAKRKPIAQLELTDLLAMWRFDYQRLSALFKNFSAYVQQWEVLLGRNFGIVAEEVAELASKGVSGRLIPTRPMLPVTRVNVSVPLLREEVDRLTAGKLCHLLHSIRHRELQSQLAALNKLEERDERAEQAVVYHLLSNKRAREASEPVFFDDLTQQVNADRFGRYGPRARRLETDDVAVAYALTTMARPTE